MIFVEFFHDFGWLFATRIRIRFIEAVPADQNETDPNGSGSATLVKNINILPIVKNPLLNSPGVVSRIAMIWILIISILELAYLGADSALWMLLNNDNN